MKHNCSKQSLVKQWLGAGVGMLILVSPIAAIAEPSILRETDGQNRAFEVRRLQVILSAGLATANPTRFYQGAEDYIAQLQHRRPDLEVTLPRASWQTQVELAARYYFPHHILLQWGLGFLQHGAENILPPGHVRGHLHYTNVILEMPLLLGGYYVPWPRLTFYSAIGPSIFLLSRSYWNFDLVKLSDFKAARGGGFHILFGAAFKVIGPAALGIEVRYRYIKTGVLIPGEAEIPPPEAIPELDLSGVNVSMNLQIAAFD